MVDKPSGPTSHDVVARVRRLAGTRKVGHAGTLDPLATGVLVLGLGRATRLLGHLALGDKDYVATARLGVRTVSDDSQGEVVATATAAGLDPATVRAEAARFLGEIEQVPSAVSAVKVDGRTAYDRVRAGEDVVLEPRRVTITRLEVTAVRPVGQWLDVDLAVTCSSGTYVRAIARDLGAALGVGGCLTALRRTRVGPFGLDRPHLGAADLARGAAGEPPDRDADAALVRAALLDLDAAVAAAFPRLDVDAATARSVSHGGTPPAAEDLGTGPLGVFGPDGVVAVMQRRGPVLRALVVLAPGSG